MINDSDYVAEVTVTKSDQRREDDAIKYKDVVDGDHKR